MAANVTSPGPSTPTDPSLGQLGRYQLVARLGGGGMAEVFRAQIVGAEGFARTVAIKRVLPGFSDNPAFAEMFVSEARVCSRLQHPNVVSVIDFDRDHERRLFLVMELVDGVDLDGLMATGPLPLPAVIYVITEVLRGLGYAHDLPDGGATSDGRVMRGLVHRDVSPHNVLVSWEGAIKVSDFGIAKARAQSAATASHIIKGKPAYMSPEQANGGALDGRSDLFAVGIMLWEMLTGQRLFVGDTREALAQLFFKPIPLPSAVRPGVPPDLEAVTMRLLARELPERTARAEDAIDELAGCADAPRDGRSELVRLLAERFAHAPKTTRTGRTPMAGSALPQHGGPGPGGSAPRPVSAHPATHGAPGHAARAPVSAVAATALAVGDVSGSAAMPTAPRRRWPVIVAVGSIVALFTLVAVVVITAGGGQGRGPGAPGGEGSGTVAGGGGGGAAAAADAASAVIVAPVDAAPAAAPADATPAPVVDAAASVRPDAGRRRPGGGGGGGGGKSGGSGDDKQIREVDLGGGK